MDTFSCYHTIMEKYNTSRQKIIIGQHRWTRDWFGIVREADGSQSKHYGPFKSVKHAEAVIRKVRGIRVEVECEVISAPEVRHE